MSHGGKKKVRLKMFLPFSVVRKHLTRWLRLLFYKEERVEASINPTSICSQSRFTQKNRWFNKKLTLSLIKYVQHKPGHTYPMSVWTLGESVLYLTIIPRWSCCCCPGFLFLFSVSHQMLYSCFILQGEGGGFTARRLLQPAKGP